MSISKSLVSQSVHISLTSGWSGWQTCEKTAFWKDEDREKWTVSQWRGTQQLSEMVITSTQSFALPLCQGHPALRDLVCLSLYVHKLCMQGLFIHWIPSFFFSLAFPTPPLPEVEIPHTSHSTVRLSHGAPFSFNTAPVWDPQPTPPHTHKSHSYSFFSENRRVGEHLLYHRGYENMWILEGMWEGMRRDCHQLVSRNQSSSWLDEITRPSCKRLLGRPNVLKYYFIGSF